MNINWIDVGVIFIIGMFNFWFGYWVGHKDTVTNQLV